MNTTLEDGCNICGAIFPAGTHHEHTTQQDSHGGDELRFIDIIADDVLRPMIRENQPFINIAMAIDERILDYAEQLATRRAAQELKKWRTMVQRLSEYVDSPDSLIEFDERIAELTAELKGHA